MSDSNPFERAKPQERVYLGGDSLIGTKWTDTAVQNYAEEHFKYFDAAAHAAMLLEQPGETAGSEQVEAAAAEEEEQLDPEDDIDEETAERVLGLQPQQDQPQGKPDVEDEDDAQQTPKPHIPTAECRDPEQMLGKRDSLLRSLENTVLGPSREEFGELCHLLFNIRGAREILDSVSTHTGVSLMTPNLYRGLLTRLTY